MTQSTRMRIVRLVAKVFGCRPKDLTQRRDPRRLDRVRCALSWCADLYVGGGHPTRAAEIMSLPVPTQASRVWRAQNHAQTDDAYKARLHLCGERVLDMLDRDEGRLPSRGKG